MADDDFTSRSLTNDQLHAEVKAFCDQSSHKDGGLPVAPDTAVALTELTLGMCGTKQQPFHAFLYYFLSTLGGVNDIIIEILAKDLESFAAHAKRSTITTDDVLLMARKSPELQAKIQAIVDKAQSEKQKNAAHKKSRK